MNTTDDEETADAELVDLALADHEYIDRCRAWTRADLPGRERERETRLPSNVVDMTGRRCGRLTVIAYAGTVEWGRKGATAAGWDCRCDCGNLITVAGCQLRNGHVKSCGCLRRENGRKRLRTSHERKTTKEESCANNAEA